MKRLTAILTALLLPILVLAQSAFGGSFPSTGTAVGVKDAAGKMQPLRSLTSDPVIGQPAPAARIIFPDEHLSIFGDLQVAQKAVILNLSFHYSVNPYFVSIDSTNGATVTQANNYAVLQSGTNPAGHAGITSKAAMRYLAGVGIGTIFGCKFTAGVANSSQIVGLGDDVDAGVHFGYNNTTFGIFLWTSGVATFVPQSSFNADKLDGTGPSTRTIDPTKLNVYRISASRSTAIQYYWYDAITTRWVLAHTISSPVAAPNISNPSLPLFAHSTNTGNTINVTVSISGMSAYREEQNPGWDIVFANEVGSTGNSKTNTTELSIISIQDKASFQGLSNRTRVKISGISFSNNNQTLVVRAILNTTLGGSPSYADFDTSTSVVAIDTAGTTVSGGREVWRGSIGTGGGGNGAYVDVSSLNIILNPGDTLTFSALSGGSQTVNVGVQWEELFTG